MGRYPTGPDADPDYAVKSLSAPGPIVIFAFWGLVVLSFSIWAIYKSSYLKRRPKRPIQMKHGDTLSQQHENEPAFVPVGDEKLSDPKQAAFAEKDTRLEITEEKPIEMQGYKESIFGQYCYVLCYLTSLQWVALFVLILYDYYANCQLYGIDSWCFYGSNPIFGSYLNNGQIMFVCWVLNMFWFTTWIALAGRVRNIFRLECPIAEAQAVVVWAPNSSEILSANVMLPVLWVRRLKDKLSPPSLRGTFTTVPVQRSHAGQKFFLHHGIRFLIKEGSVHRGELRVGEDFSDYHRHAKGLTAHEAGLRLDHVGPNEIPFKVDNLWRLINNEFVSFFYNYQWVFYQLWLWFSYLFPGAIMVCVVLVSGIVNLWLTHRAQVAIAKISEYVTEADVLRDGQWVKVNSKQLVPGDVILLRSNWLLPADFVIIQGSCVCNESALTGEAMPVQKYACPNDATKYDTHSGARHMLFAGTTLLQAGSNQGDQVLAVCSATGMGTGKGDLLSEILYPQAMIFKYDEELVVVLGMLFVYAAVCAVMAIIIQSVRGQNSDWITKWIYMTFIVSQILSPILPVCLNVGQQNAMVRLRKKGVNCLNAKRIAISGKIRVFCFDKTGTLTRDGLDFLGVRPIVDGVLSPMHEDVRNGSLVPVVLDSLATCHAVSAFGDGYVGNQVEVKMFEATGWKLLEYQDKPADVVSPDGSRRLTIVRKNEFDHGKQTMSVIAKDDQNNHFVFCKGSFEKIGDISLPESRPANYLAEAQALALEGCYVLGMSFKNLGRMRSEEALALSRDQVEAGLTFISLLAFRNELKHDTRDAIIEMKEGQVRPVMITGDNAQCGQYVAKACGMTAQECPIYLADIHDGQLQWKLTGHENIDRPPLSSEELMNSCLPDLQAGRIELAMTGKAFRVIRTTSLMSDILYFVRIFARVTPEEKVQVCNLWRDAGLVIGMAGDGGNDCGALRAAHAGVALSDAEASVVSPFTSKSKSVQSVVDLLREGRGALHTSFGAVKFLIIYGLNFSVFKLTSYWFGCLPSPFMYLSIDAFAVLTLGYSVTLSHPSKKLRKRRPTSSLIGPLHVSSVLGYWLFTLAFLIGAIYLMKNDKDYVAWPTRLSKGASWWTLGDNWESTIIFFTTYFSFLSSAFIFTFGSSFRRIVFRNWVLMGFYLFLMVFYSWLLLSKPNSATRYFHIASEQFNTADPDPTTAPVWSAYHTQLGGQASPAMPLSFRFKLWALCMANTLIGIFWQKGVAEGLVSNYLRKRFPSKRPVFNM